MDKAENNIKDSAIDFLQLKATVSVKPEGKTLCFVLMVFRWL